MRGSIVAPSWLHRGKPSISTRFVIYLHTLLHRPETAVISRRHTQEFAMGGGSGVVSQLRLMTALAFLALCLLLQSATTSAGEYTNGLDSQVRPDRDYIQRSRNIHVAVTIDRNSISQFLFPLYVSIVVEVVIVVVVLLGVCVSPPPPLFPPFSH